MQQPPVYILVIENGECKYLSEDYDLTSNFDEKMVVPFDKARGIISVFTAENPGIWASIMADWELELKQEFPILSLPQSPVWNHRKKRYIRYPLPTNREG